LPAKADELKMGTAGDFIPLTPDKSYLLRDARWAFYKGATGTGSGLPTARLFREKLRYYRDGMQMWKLWGLTTVAPQ
jgi:hypothetical protein